MLCNRGSDFQGSTVHFTIFLKLPGDVRVFVGAV